MMKKKILLLFALLQFASIIKIQAETHRGYCGADGSKITYRLDTETGLLEISGSGEMEDYEGIETGEGDEDYIFNSPWFNHRDNIRKIVISYGITHIGAGAFAGCKSVTVITLPNSLNSIGEGAFWDCI